MPALDYPRGEDSGEAAVDDGADTGERPGARDAAAMQARADDHMDLVESQATGTFETIVLEGDGYLQTEEHVDEGIVNAQIEQLTRQLDGNAAQAAAAEQAEQHPDEEIILETPSEAAEEDFDADAAVGNRRHHHWVWWLAVAVLTLALAGMLLHNNRQKLVAHPLLQRPVQTFYGWFGVTVEPRWDVQAYDVRQFSGDVLIGADDSFTVQASVHNLATIAQPPPIIRVQLLDRYQNLLSTTDIAPSQYLLSAAPARMAPDQRFDTTLTVRDPTREAAGFQLDACLPAEGGKLRCSNDP